MRPGGGLRRVALADVGRWLLELGRALVLVVAIAAAAVLAVAALVVLGIWGGVGRP
jgi:hypothetical protein